jgi:hypothetical protein
MSPESNWRSSATYEYLHELEPSELAWEFLRRNPDYERDYRKTRRRDPDADDGAKASARFWGLRFRDRSAVAIGSSAAGLAAPS